MKNSGQPSLFKVCLLLVMLLSYTDTYVFAKPRGGQVVSGTASFTQDGNLTVITAGNRSIINYQSFDIGKNETVQFVQPNAHSTVLNRVLTPDPTNIFGHLEANGIVVIANPYGVFFQNGSVVNVGGVIAGAGKVSDADFTAGKIHFTDLTGDVRNDGLIAADNQIALMGANVVNTGSMTAARGVAMMVSGPDVYVGNKNGNIFVQANGKAVKAAAATGVTGRSAGGVTNSGTVSAPRVVLGAGDMYSTAIVNSGLLQGRAVTVNAGTKGSVALGGKIDATSASNPTATGKGGNVNVLGGTIALRGATLDASGAAGGGNVRLGGDFHGDGTLAHSATTTVDAASTIKADATGPAGNGGTVVLWSDSATAYAGTISAKGGATGGNGGSVEVSSHNALGFYGVVKTDAPAGQIGSLLLDPSNIEITTTTGNDDVAFAVTPSATANSPLVTTPAKLTISQTALEGATAAITLSASNDILIDALTGGKLTLQANATFTAGTNTVPSGVPPTAQASVGSVVMVGLTDTIDTTGHTLTINADGPSVGANAGAVGPGTGINGIASATNPTPDTTNAISLGKITSEGGAVTLNITPSGGLVTTAPIKVAGAIDASSATGAGGTIMITGSAAANLPTAITVGGDLTASATGATAGSAGNGGTVTLASRGTINITGNTDVSSAGAAGGTITLGGTGATLPTSVTTGTTMAGGRLTASATGTGAGLTGAGGTVTVTAAGPVTLNGAVNTSSAGAAGGNITLTGTGNMTTGNLNAGATALTGTNNGGAVAASTTGTLGVGTVTTSSGSGAGGAITLGKAGTVPTGITASSTLTSSGTTAAGNIMALSSGGVGLTGDVTASATAGAGGLIEVQAKGAVTAANITAAATTTPGLIVIGDSTVALPGYVPTSIALTGAFNTANTGTGATANGGAISLLSTGLVSFNNANTSSTAGAGGGIVIGGAATNGTNYFPSGVTIRGDGGSPATALQTTGVAGGTITLSSAGGIGVTGRILTTGTTGAGGSVVALTKPSSATALDSFGAITTSSTSGVSGSVLLGYDGTTVFAPGTLTLGGAITTSSTSGTGGTVSLVSSGLITGGANTITTSTSTAGAAGNISFTGTGLTIGALDASAFGQGGAVSVGVSGALTLTNTVTTASSNGAGGNIALTAPGVAATSLVTSGGGGNGGNVTITSAGGIALSDVIYAPATGATGNGGNVALLTNVTNTTATPVSVQGITTVALGNGNGGIINVGKANAGTNLPTGITLNAPLNSYTSGTAATNNGGGVTLSTSGAVGGGSNAINASSVGGTGGTITANAAGVTLGALTSKGGSGGGVALISAGGITVNGGIDASASGASGTGGTVALLTNVTDATATPVSVQGISTASAGTGGAGNISIANNTGAKLPTGITLGSALNANDTSASGGAGGTVTLLTSGVLAGGTNTINASSNSSAAGGNITLNSGGTLNIGNLASTAAGTGAGGAVTLLTTATNAATDTTVTAGSITTTSAGGTGGAVTIKNATGDLRPTAITVGAINTAGTGTTNGGPIDLETSGTLTLATTTPSFTGNTILYAANTSAAATNTSTFTTNGYDFSLTLTGQFINTSSILDTPNNLVLGGQGVTIDSNTLSAKASETFNAPVTVAASATLMAGLVTAASNITFSNTVRDQASGIHLLTLQAGSAGGVFFNGAVGDNGHPLYSLSASTLTGGGVEPVTLGGASVTTTNGVQSYGTLTLGGTGTKTLTSTGPSGSITSGAVTGTGLGLTVNSAGTSNFAALGATGAALGAVDFEVAGVATFTGTIAASSFKLGATTVGTRGVFSGGGNTVATTLGQTYGEPVQLANDTIFADSNGGTISLLAVTTDGTARALTTSTSGQTIFGGQIGTLANPLSTLTAGLAAPGNLGGTTRLNGGSIFTSGTQTYNDFVTLGATTALNAGAGAITFVKTVGSQTTPQALGITTTGLTTFNDVVGGPTITPGATLGTFVNAPALASLSVSGPTLIKGTSITTVTGTGGTQTYTGQVTLGNNVTLQGNSANFGGGITEATAGQYNLTLNFAGQVSLPGTNLLTSVGDFTSEGGGGVLINNTIQTYGSQTYSGGAVVIATGAPTNLSLTAGMTNTAGNITLSSTLDEQTTAGLHNLTLTAGSGGIVIIGAAIGSIHPLLSLTALTRMTGATSSAEPVTINAVGVTTVGSQSYGTLNLGGTGTTTLSSTATTGAVGINSGPVTGNGNPLTVNVASTGGSSTLGAISGAGTVTLNDSGTTTVASVNDTAPVVFTGGAISFTGGVTASGVSVTASGAAGFGGAVAVSGNVGVMAAGATTFGSTLNAADVTINGAGSTTFGGAVTASSLTVTGGTGVTINAGTITTTGEQNYNEPATLASTTALTGQGTVANGGVAVRFGSTLTGDFALTLANTAGTGGAVSDTIFANTVGTLLSLTTSTVGTTRITGGTGITTNGGGGQLYRGPLLIGTTTTLAAGTGPVNFSTANSTVGSLTSPQALTITTSGQTTFTAQVGGTSTAGGPALASLMTSTGPVSINSGVTTVATPGGFQNYGGTVTLTGDTTLQGYSLTLGGGLVGQNHDLTLNFTTQVGLPGGITGLNNFTTNGAGGVLLGGAFGTGGNQTYNNGAVTLGANSTLTSTAGSLNFNTPVDGNFTLGLSATGAGGKATFATGALVGNTIPIGAFTSSTAAGTVFNMTAGNAATGKGGFNAASVAVTGPTTFGETGASTAHPDVQTTGAQSYRTGAVAGPVLLGQDTYLTSTAGGSIDFGISTATAATINSAAGTTRKLTLSTTGTQTFYGVVGANDALSGLTTGTGPTVFNMTIGATDPAGVRVNGAVLVGGTTTFNVAGSVNPGKPSVLTLGAASAQTYTGAVLLQGAVTVLNSATTGPSPGFSLGGPIRFNGNITSANGTQELDVYAGEGATVFDGTVTTTGAFPAGGADVVFAGNVGPLGTFTVQPNTNTGAGSTDLNGTAYSALSFPFASPLFLSNNVTLSISGGGTGGITFGALDGGVGLFPGPYSLTLNLTGGNVAFNGLVGNTVPLASLTIFNSGATVGTTTFAMSLAGAAAGKGGVNVLGISGAPAVRVDNKVDFEAVGAAGGTVPTILTGGTYNAQVGTGGQVYNGAATVGATATLGQNTVLRDAAASADITFNGTVDATASGAGGLSVNANGDEIFAGLVGNTNRLSVLSTDDVSGGTGTTRFNMTIGGAPGGVQLTGALNVNDRVAFNATGGTTTPTILSGAAQTYALPATVRQNTVLTATGGNITFNGTVDSGTTASALTVNTPGDEIFGGAVGGSAPLTTLTTDNPAVLSPAGHVIFGLAGATVPLNVTTSGTQTYNDAAQLRADTVLTSSGDSLVFKGTVDSFSASDLHSLTTNTPNGNGVVTFAKQVGSDGVTPLTSLTTNGQGTTQINGGVVGNSTTIATTGAQEYLQAVTVGDNARLNAGTRLDFSSSLDGAHDVTLTADTLSLVAVGNATPLSSLTINPTTRVTFTYTPALVSPGNAGVNLVGVLVITGPATFDATGVAGSVDFVRTGVGQLPSGGQDYEGTFTLAGTATFTDLHNDMIVFRRSVDGSGGVANLTVSTGGQMDFFGQVGANVPLTSLTLNNFGVATGEVILNGTSVTTTGSQTYNDNVLLSLAASTFTSTASGDVTFALTLDSLVGVVQAATIKTAGRTIFGGMVGANYGLASLTTDYEGTSDLGTQINGGLVRTTGAQTYADAVTLGLDTTLRSTGNGNIGFGRTVDSATSGTPEALFIYTGGQTAFGGRVGATNALASVFTDTPGTLAFNGVSVRTTGAQTYNDPATLGANVALTSTGGGVLTLGNTVDGAFTLTLNTSGQAVFSQPVGNATALTGLTSNGGTTQFNMPVGPVAGVVVNGPVLVNNAVVFNIGGATPAKPGVLTIGNNNQTYNGPVSLQTNTYLTSAAALPGAGGVFTGGGSVAFNAPQGIVSAGGGDLFVRAGVGALSLGSTVNANTLDLGGVAVTVAGPVNITGTLSLESNDQTGGGSITFGGGTITTVGAQVYNVPFVLGNATILTSTGGGDLTFNSTVDGAFALTLDSTGNEIFKGQVGGTTPLASLTTDDPARIQPGGNVIFAFAGTTAAPSVTTTGAQAYHDAALLQAGTTLASTGGGLTFFSTVDGAFALTLNAAGDETFNGRVGGTTALTSLVTDDPAGAISGGHVVFAVPNSTAAVPGVTTTGAQSYNDAALLATNTVLASTGGGTLTFGSTVDSASTSAPRSLTLDSAGNEVFRGVVGGTAALLSVVTDDPAGGLSGGRVVFNVPGGGRSVTTVSTQTYNDAVTLAADTTLFSTNDNITLASTVDGAQTLTLSTPGIITFGAPVGGITPLASLTTQGGGAVALNGRTVTTTGLQSYGGAVRLGDETSLTSTAGGISFVSTVDGAHGLTLTAAGDETFNNRVGGTTALTNLTTNASAAGGRVVFAIGGSSSAVPGVRTTGAQTYNNAALLQADTFLASTGGGGLTFNSTVDGAFAFTLNTAGDEVFNAQVGGKVALASLTTDDPTGGVSGGRVIFNVAGSAVGTPSVTTFGAQTYNDALFMQADTVLTSTGKGDLTFNSTVDGARALSLNSVGDETFNQRVGGGQALASLSTDADIANRGGRVVFNIANGSTATPSVLTTGAQTYRDAAVLRAVGTTVLTSSGGGTLTFGSTVDSSDPNIRNARSLTLNTTGDEVFAGAVGGSKPLANLLTDDDAANGGGHVIFAFAGSTGTPSVTTTGVQTYRDAATLRAATVLTSSGNAAITFDRTIDGAFGLTLTTAGPTTLSGAVGGGTPLASLFVLGGGAVALNGGTITTSGAQDFSGAATLGTDTTLASSNGDITFELTLGGTQNLTLNTPVGTTNFGGAVGANGGDGVLATLTATDGSAVAINGGSVTTLGLQTYGGHVSVSAPDGGVTTLAAIDNRLLGNGSQANNIVFKRDVDVNTGSLLVSGWRILAESDSNINVVGAGDLNLEASNTLILQGDTYGSGSGRVILNDLGNANVPDPAQRATIFLSNPGRTQFRGGSFDMGYLQNMFSRGSVAINVPGGAATLSDIAANGTLTVQAAQIFLRARDPDGARGAAGGGTDDGLNFVARTSITFGNTPIRYDNGHSSNDIANFVTSTGQVTINRESARGISIFQDPTLPISFSQAGGGGITDANFDTFVFPFQLISGGTQTIDTAAALSGALPDQKPLDVAVDITISASQLEELLKLGIHPRKAQKQERLSLASKRALFAQLVDGLDQDNYGRLQPIKGGISRLVPSDYVVVVDRMSEHEVQDILTAFEGLYGKNKEKVPPIGQAFNTAFTDYSTEKQTADAAGFAPYIAGSKGKYPDVDKAVRGFDNLFGYIEHIGLTAKEQAKAKEHIASDLQVAGVSSEDMVKVIDTLRAKIPKNQQAPSTKLPPSAPAGNPAPNATSPGQPEQKKGTPPLKSARQARPVGEDRQREVAGL